MEANLNLGWLNELKQEIEGALSMSFNWSEYELPLKLSPPTQSPYTPRVVSIGPLYHGDPRLADMEKLKLWYVASFLRRNIGNSLQDTLASCVSAVLRGKDAAQGCYRAHRFTGNIERLLLVDGCFTLELFLRYYAAYGGVIPNDHPIFRQVTDIASDPLLKFMWTQSILRQDLAMLENQIPFFLLQDLLQEVSTAALPNDFVATMAFYFFKPSLPNSWRAQTPLSVFGDQRIHLLHLLLNIYTQPEAQAGTPTNTETTINIYDDSPPLNPWRAFIRSATELSENGVAFEMSPNANLLDLQFKDGVFRIPPLHLNECTDSLFKNLMALELYLQQNRKPLVASYVLLMSHLIRRPEDVSLLEAKGIITNNLGNGVGVCLLFQGMIAQNTPTKFCFEKLCNRVEAYFLFRCSLAQQLKRGYLLTRCGFMSILVVYLLLIIVVLLAFAGTFFANDIGLSVLLFIFFAAYATRKLEQFLRKAQVTWKVTGPE